MYSIGVIKSFSEEALSVLIKSVCFAHVLSSKQLCIHKRSYVSYRGCSCALILVI